MSDWVKPPWEIWHGTLWMRLFRGFDDLHTHYIAATRALNPNAISCQRMEKFTQACVIAKLKGEHLK